MNSGRKTSHSLIDKRKAVSNICSSLTVERACERVSCLIRGLRTREAVAKDDPSAGHAKRLVFHRINESERNREEVDSRSKQISNRRQRLILVVMHES